MNVISAPRTANNPGVLAALLTRSLKACARTPSMILTPLLTSAFFLIVYEAQLSTVVSATPGAEGYAAIILPLCLLTTAFTAGGMAGQLVVRDITSGYHARLWLTPAGRWTLVAAPVLAGVSVLTVQITLITGLGLLLGADPVAGAAALPALIGAAVVIGTGFLLLAAAVGLHTGSDAAVGAVTLVFFPLSFFTATWVPRDQLDGWAAVAADVNPLTPPLEAMRDMLTAPWGEQDLLPGAVVTACLLAVGAAAAWFALVRRTRTGV